MVLNTAIIVGAALLLALSPATISQHVTTEEWVALAAITALAVVVNVLLLRQVFVPLHRVEHAIRGIHPLEPGRRVPLVHAASGEVARMAAALNEMLERLESERARSGRIALEAQESERRRVARELHDEVGQLLTGVVLQLDGLTRRVPGELREEVELLQASARDGVEAVREIARGLRPPALDEFGLRSALIALATSITERTGVPVHPDIEPRLPPLAPETELALYRIAQESLTNSIRHGRPSAVSLHLNLRGDELVLRVRDDGIGIAGEVSEARGTGLTGMRERALLVGGRLRIHSVVGQGTGVELTLPLR